MNRNQAERATGPALERYYQSDQQGATMKYASIVMLIGGALAASIALAEDSTACKKGDVDFCTQVDVARTHVGAEAVIGTGEAIKDAYDGTGARLGNIKDAFDGALGINRPVVSDVPLEPAPAAAKAPMTATERARICANLFSARQKSTAAAIDDVRQCQANPPAPGCNSSYVGRRLARERELIAGSGCTDGAYASRFRQLQESLASAESQYELKSNTAAALAAAPASPPAGGAKERFLTGLEGMPAGYDPNNPDGRPQAASGSAGGLNAAIQRQYLEIETQKQVALAHEAAERDRQAAASAELARVEAARAETARAAEADEDASALIGLFGAVLNAYGARRGAAAAARPTPSSMADWCRSMGKTLGKDCGGGSGAVIVAPGR